MAKPQIRIFKMENSRVYYTPTAYVPISHTSFGHLNVNVQFSPNTYWKVEVENYDSDSMEVKVRVKDYNSSDSAAFKAQETSVQLKGLRIAHLEGSRPSMGITEYPIDKTEELPIAAGKIPDIAFLVEEEDHKISYPIKKLDFQDSKIHLQLDNTLISNLPSRIKLEVFIDNQASRNELNAIKPFIIKSLGAEAVTINVKLARIRQGYYEASGQSEELNQINERVIERAKYDYVLRMISSSSGDDPKSFSPEEYGEKKLGMKISPVKTLDFFRDINLLKQALHFDHIEYLCVRQNEYYPIRFITSPAFAFLLVLETKASFYAVLECYDKRFATYVWRYGKNASDVKAQLSQVNIEVEAELIKSGKRASYIRSKPENFFKIEHNYLAPNGFVLWKEELEAKII